MQVESISFLPGDTLYIRTPEGHVKECLVDEDLKIRVSPNILTMSNKIFKNKDRLKHFEETKYESFKEACERGKTILEECSGDSCVPCFFDKNEDPTIDTILTMVGEGPDYEVKAIVKEDRTLLTVAYYKPAWLSGFKTFLSVQMDINKCRKILKQLEFKGYTDKGVALLSQIFTLGKEGNEVALDADLEKVYFAPIDKELFYTLLNTMTKVVEHYKEK